MADDLSSNGQPPPKDPLLAEAQTRFRKSKEWEGIFRQRFLDDIKIANADADNGYQWPNDIKRNRDIDQRPTLTINMIRQHNNMIINDAEQNKPEIKIRPVGNGATYDAAQMWQGIIRHIEYISNASVAYDTARTFQVQGGYGVVRLLTDYVSADSWDQEIYIKRVWDPLSVYFDPDCKELDKSDAKFVFIFDEMDKDAFEDEYPEYAGMATESPLGTDGWLTNDRIRIAEYWYKSQLADKLWRFTDPTNGKKTTVRESALPPELKAWVKAQDDAISREVLEPKVRWCKVIGANIVDEREWPGKWIPVVPFIGEETVIDGVMDRKGHTRYLIDPQRIYNFFSSAAVEFATLQSKTPYLAPAAAIEELESLWNSANTVNYAVLPYNHLDDDGNPIPSPVRAQPPVQADAYIKAMQISGMEMKMASGQWQAQMGEPGNERSGAAINERQRQGDTATYHFINNEAVAIRRIGEILLDLIPHIYDTPRVIKILANDDPDMEVEIDPQAKQAYIQELDKEEKVAKRILNPQIGQYAVEADIGPAYATRRQEAFNAIKLILTQSPELAAIIGDLLFRNADFPDADEIARRLKRGVPPQYLGQGPSKTEQELTQQLQLATGELQKLQMEVEVSRVKLKGKDEMREIDAYNAETQRLKVVLADMAADQAQMHEIVSQLSDQIHQTNLQAASQVTEEGGDPASGGGGGGPTNGSAGPSSSAPMLGAKQAPDGNWYIPDPARPGKYTQVISHGG